MTLRLLADENFDGDIVRGLLRQWPDLDIVRVQDSGLAGVDDPAVLEWATREGRVLLTHDVNTVPRFAFAYERVQAGQPMAGVVEVPQSLPIGRALEDILLLATISRPEEVAGQVLYLPLS
ncbi:MAG: DUF5615 family PIN-like protein [Chloroflexota bacterium]